MSIKQNESMEELPENQPEGNPVRQDDRESWFSDLFDLRIMVFFVSVAVIVMTATVLILSGDVDESASIDPNGAEQESRVPASSVAQTDLKQPVTRDQADSPDTGAETQTKSLVEQANDGSIELPLRSASVSGCESTKAGISNWQSGGSARWQLAVRDRHSGFFHCHVTYVAKFQSQFSVQLGDRQPLNFTIYPHETDFTEQFIIRLDTPKESSLRLIAKKIEKVSGVTIKKIVLIPR